MVTSVPDPAAELDGEALERERAILAARAGLDDPGPVPAAEARTPGSPDEGSPDDAERRPMTGSEITSDRGALLRLFSGLRDQS